VSIAAARATMNIIRRGQERCAIATSNRPPPVQAWSSALRGVLRMRVRCVRRQKSPRARSKRKELCALLRVQRKRRSA